MTVRMSGDTLGRVRLSDSRERPATHPRGSRGAYLSRHCAAVSSQMCERLGGCLCWRAASDAADSRTSYRPHITPVRAPHPVSRTRTGT